MADPNQTDECAEGMEQAVEAISRHAEAADRQPTAALDCRQREVNAQNDQQDSAHCPVALALRLP